MSTYAEHRELKFRELNLKKSCDDSLAAVSELIRRSRKSDTDVDEVAIWQYSWPISFRKRYGLTGRPFEASCVLVLGVRV